MSLLAENMAQQNETNEEEDWTMDCEDDAQPWPEEGGDAVEEPRKGDEVD